MADHIPYDLLTKILVNLRVKSLVRLSCVCKSWQSLITSSDFITDHLNQTKASNDNHGNPCILLRYNPCPSTRVLGSCNGLICFSDIRIKISIVLWNPSIMKSLTLPLPRTIYPPHRQFDRVYGFGFDSRTNDYKVVSLVYYTSKVARSKLVMAELYKLSTGRWEPITSTIDTYCVANFSRDVGTAFVNSSVHWRACKDGPRDLILSFDMSEEVFREIMLPETAYLWTDIHVAVCGEWLSFFDTYNKSFVKHCSVWVMTEYGVVESWTKLYTVDLFGGLEMALGFRKNRELILAKKNGELVSYDSETKQIKYLGSSHLCGEFLECVDRCQFSMDAYVESLVLLGDANRLGSKQSSEERCFHQS